MWRTAWLGRIWSAQLENMDEDKSWDKNWYESVDAEQKKSWIRQDNLIYGGLIGVGVVIIQPFLTATSLDLSAFIAVIAFAVALPLLGSMVIVDYQANPSGSYPSWAGLGAIAKSVGIGGACVGVVAALWHVHWIAGAVVLVSGAAALAVLIVGQPGPPLSARPSTDDARRGGNAADSET